MTSSRLLIIAISACVLLVGCASKEERQAVSQLSLPTPVKIQGNPAYDTVDIRSAIARGNSIKIKGQQRFMEQNQDRVLDSLLQPGVRPAPNAVTYYTVTIDREVHLTMQLSSSKSNAIVVFTSESRAKHYASQVPDWDTEGEIGVVGFSETEWASNVKDWISGGITHMLIDQCPDCAEAAAFELMDDASDEDWVHVCTFVNATRILQYEFYLREGRAAFAKGDFRRGREIGEYVVAFVDAERPEVHLFLAECGIAMQDQDLVNRKEMILQYFGQGWAHKLQELKRTGGGT